MERLRLYHIDIVIPQGSKRYCIPLSSPKPKHEHMRNGRDLTKVFDPKGRLIAVLNFNNMVPVSDAVITPADLRIREGDDKPTRSYKMLMRNEVEWCNAHAGEISRKASKLYRIVTERSDEFRALVRRCCDFRRLEDVLASYAVDDK